MIDFTEGLRAMLVEAATEGARIALAERVAPAPPSTPIEKMFTVAEAAELARRSLRSMREKVQKGTVRSLLVDGRRLVPESALVAYLGGAADAALDAEAAKLLAPRKLRVVGSR